MDIGIEEQYDKIYKYCYFHVRNRTLAEDLTQETFLRYLGKTEHALWGEKQLAYLYTIARNLCIDYFRKSGREVLGFGEWGVEEALEEAVVSGDGGFPAGGMHGKDGVCLNQLPEQLALRQAVLALPEEMRELVWLRFVQEESAAAVGEILGISRFAVYRREKQALALLRKRLEGETEL